MQKRKTRIVESLYSHAHTIDIHGTQFIDIVASDVIRIHLNRYFCIGGYTEQTVYSFKNRRKHSR